MPIAMPAVVTLGSHTALQISKGAYDEGLKSIIVATPKTASLYHRYPFISQVIEIPEYQTFPQVERKLLASRNTPIVIPHGSFVAYLGMQKNKEMKLPYFGNKAVLDFEFDRDRQRDWLKAADIRVPKEFKSEKEIDRTVIVKAFGAEGGSGYFLARNKAEFKESIVKLKGKKHTIQEYVMGVPMYIHYFYSPLSKKLEILSVDRRYESNVDGLGRLPLHHQNDSIEPSFTVVGNSPLSVRESLLPELYHMGERVIEASRKLISKQGLFGPFCLEMIVDSEQKFWVIEISARIVAGTNLFINGSPYSDLFYKEPMSTGRRIAREIKLAYQEKKLALILHQP